MNFILSDQSALARLITSKWRNNIRLPMMYWRGTGDLGQTSGLYDLHLAMPDWPKNYNVTKAK